jgi:TRAP-type mannitol/chloroaromatic compound transport system permease small subunit
MNGLERLAIWLEAINEWCGRLVSWLSVLLVALICVDVLMRYFFDFTLIWIIELEIYFFALLFLLASGYALKHDKHVRVDVFYSKMSKKQKATVDFIGTLLFLIPWCVVIIWVSYKYAYMSFLIGEKSPQPGGLPALYLLKFSIVAAFALLLVQGISVMVRSVITWKG